MAPWENYMRVIATDKKEALFVGSGFKELELGSAFTTSPDPYATIRAFDVEYTEIVTLVSEFVHDDRFLVNDRYWARICTMKSEGSLRVPWKQMRSVQLGPSNFEAEINQSLELVERHAPVGTFHWFLRVLKGLGYINTWERMESKLYVVEAHYVQSGYKRIIHRFCLDFTKDFPTLEHMSVALVADFSSLKRFYMETDRRNAALDTFFEVAATE
jgi:hypothetical protein